MAEAVTVGATLRTGWPVLVIPSAIYFVSHFHRIALGVVAQDLMRAFTITAATLGALAAIYPYVVAAGPLALLVEAIGWRASFEAIGAITVALAVVAVLGVRERRDSTPRTVTRSLRDVVVGIPAIILNPRTWPPVLAGAGMYSTVIALQGLWGVSYLTQVHGLPRVQAAADIAWMAVGVMVGAPL